MSLIDRYIGKQVLLGTLFAVLVLTLVFGLGHIFKVVLPELVENQLPMGTFFRSVLYILPFSVVFTIPWGFLTAILLTFGRLSADSEFVGMRTAGMSMGRICRSVFFLAAVLSAFCFWCNVSVSPRAKAKSKALIYEMARQDPSVAFSDNSVVQLGGRLIYTEKKEGSVLRNAQIVELAEDKKMGDAPLGYFSASSLRIEMNETRDQFILPMEEIYMEIRDPDEPRNVGKARPGITARNYTHEISFKEKMRTKPTEKTVAEIRQSLAAGEVAEKKIRDFEVEITKRYSFSLACLTFCFVGIPLGITAQRRETSIGFALSLVVAILYFSFILFGETVSDHRILPHVLMWLPNVLFLGIGALLFHRINS
ncbi:MAG: LptF/LptG family permease [Verrucomicrobiota bacterium]